MRTARLALVGVMVAAATALATGPASAATSSTVVTPEELHGWSVDTPAPAFDFVEGPKTLGVGSLQFETIDNAPAPAEKMFVKHSESIAQGTFEGVAFDYFIAPTATNTTPAQWYLNVYVDDGSIPGPPANFYDCKYDYVATAGGDGWHTLSVTGTTAATNVTPRGAATCGTSPEGAPAGSSIFLIALNAGDTSASDTGVQGGFDNVRVSAAGHTTVYDFEPPRSACPTTTIAGTTGPDALRGTPGADGIDGKAGDDSIDAEDGADRISGGPGRDGVRGGAGDDVIDVKDGEIDLVDCGPGRDEVVADLLDVVANCENVTY